MAIRIGINGIKGSGKDHFGMIMSHVLRNKLTIDGRDPVVAIKSFADPIRKFVETIFGTMDDSQYDEFKRTQHPMNIGGTPRLVHGRTVVRGIGMKMRSYDGGQQFLDYMNEDGNADIIICTDLRFDNEFEGVDWFSKSQVVNPGVASDGHVSEKVWPVEMFDNVVCNDGGEDGSHNMVASSTNLAVDIATAEGSKFSMNLVPRL